MWSAEIIKRGRKVVATIEARITSSLLPGKANPAFASWDALGFLCANPKLVEINTHAKRPELVVEADS